MTPSPVRRIANGVAVAVRLTPKARTNRIVGVAARSDGATVLKVSVTAAPERGKANAALLGLLSKAWRTPKSALSLASGMTDRRKTVHVAGDPDTLKRILDKWAATHG